MTPNDKLMGILNYNFISNNNTLPGQKTNNVKHLIKNKKDSGDSLSLKKKCGQNKVWNYVDCRIIINIW